MDLETAIDQQRALNSAASRSRRIFRKKSTPKPSALDEIRANSPMAKMGRAFEQSQAPAKRASRVAAAKENGQFDAIRERYNTQYAGKYSMDKDGNVGTSNSSPSASKKADTATPPKAKTPLPPTIARPSDQAETPKPTPRPTSGVIRDETGDITSKIQGRLAEKRKPMMPAATPAVAAQPAAPKAQTAGEMMAEVDGAIAKNKDAVSALNKSFAKKPQVSQAEKSLGKPVVDNLDKGSNYVPYTKGEPQSRSKKIRMDFIDRETSKRTPAPSPSTLAKSGGVGTESKTAPAGGWGKLAKDNFDKSMAADFGRVAKREAGEAVDAGKNQIDKINYALNVLAALTERKVESKDELDRLYNWYQGEGIAVCKVSMSSGLVFVTRREQDGGLVAAYFGGESANTDLVVE